MDDRENEEDAEGFSVALPSPPVGFLLSSGWQFFSSFASRGWVVWSVLEVEFGCLVTLSVGCISVRLSVTGVSVFSFVSVFAFVSLLLALGSRDIVFFSFGVL